MSIVFEWDEAKSRSNSRKHGISFELASEVFLDPLRISVLERIVDGEERWQTFGLVAGVPLCMVAHTYREELSEGNWVELVRIVSARRAEPIEGDVMKSKMVRYTFGTLPKATESDRARLRELAQRPDGEIDTSDIPVLTEEQWKNAVRGGFYRPVKEQITARVDADVLAWLREQGKGYQSRINAILRREMLAARKQQTTQT